MELVTAMKSDKKGYILLFVRGKWRYEHRLVVEEFIGRRLPKEWVVHHIDEDKQNNDINNLMIFKSQKDHSSFHNKTKRGMTNPIRTLIRTRWAEFGK